ncbi:RHS repeat domain-containing protein [Pseudomonas brassicae]|nr:RHS repeat-associated core domain-containing protein [Pseudomonas brassicae]
MSEYKGELCMDALKKLGRKVGATMLALTMTNSAIADTVTYFHNDISGSPLAATDPAGNLLWRENYKPYGEKLTRSAASSANTIGFHGKAHDDGTGLSYMGARYYNPVLGRFMGVDPVDFQIENLHSFNRYTYANNNPYKYVDPDGRYAHLLVAMVYALTALSATLTIQTALNGFSQHGQGDVSIGPLSFPGSDIDRSSQWQKASESSSGHSPPKDSTKSPEKK